MRGKPNDSDEPIRLHESTFRIDWRTAFGEGGEGDEEFWRLFRGWNLVLVILIVLGMVSDTLLSWKSIVEFPLPHIVYLALSVVHTIGSVAFLMAGIILTNRIRRPLMRIAVRVILAILLSAFIFAILLQVYARIMGWVPWYTIPNS
ncbi:MAG: hypothetical protein IT368_00320 [Candidatus Hydrogenedentes bacterium]|nr:hypothetical protein [Candidatus Hydrogenedentota bacterium]